MPPNELTLAGIIALRVKDRRKEKGLSIQDVSNITGYSLSSLGRIEMGEGLPSIMLLLSICEALGCTPNDLLI